MEALLDHARERASSASIELPTIIAGDLNQPNETDYPPCEWRAIASDMRRAGLALTDGVMETLRKDGFAPSWEDAATQRPLAASSAWNGAVVDYCYARMPATARAGGAVRLGGVEASYFYHTLASDHLPLVVDFAAVRAA